MTGTDSRGERLGIVENKKTLDEHLNRNDILVPVIDNLENLAVADPFEIDLILIGIDESDLRPERENGPFLDIGAEISDFSFAQRLYEV